MQEATEIEEHREEELRVAEVEVEKSPSVEESAVEYQCELWHSHYYEYYNLGAAPRTSVMPRDRCTRCRPVIHCCCLVICLCVMHSISCHHVHFICIHVRLMHPRIFPVVRFAFRRSVPLWWSFLTFFRVWGLNISGLDRDLPSGLGLLPVDRLSSFVPFGLRLILQRLTEGPKRPRVCCIPTPLQFCLKPT